MHALHTLYLDKQVKKKNVYYQIKGLKNAQPETPEGFDRSINSRHVNFPKMYWQCVA